MANQTFKKPVFLQVITPTDGVPVFAPAKNQTHEVNGKTEKIDTRVQVVPQVQDLDIVEGEFWATDTVIKKQAGWYVSGRELYKITDEIGMIISEFENTTHQFWAECYNDYRQGREMREDLGVQEDAEPPKPKQKTLLEKLKMDKKLAVPTIEDDGWYVDEETWYWLIRNYVKRKNTILIGSSGAGKTDLIRLMMTKIGKPIEVFDMAVSNPNKTFCGNLRADHGTTHYQLARFAKVIQQEGLILMDELSRAAPTANNIFLPLTDSRRTLYIEDAIDEKDVQIKVHDKCTIWATANIGVEFIGTSQLDHALLNRFQQVGVTYPPQDKESLVLQKRCGLSRRDADALAKVAHEIRISSSLSKDISTRQLLEIAEAMADGYRAVDAFKRTVLQQFEGNEHDGGEQQTVLAIIQSL